MALNKWFENGLTQEEYMTRLDKHKDNFMHIYHNFTLPEDTEFFQATKEKNIRVIALAEVWCGHCMLNIPILLHLAKAANIPVRFIPRDENLELMDQYLTNEKRYIPIFVFIDEQGNEVGKWGPWAEATKSFVDELKKDLPPKDAPDYDEKFKEVIAKSTKEFTSNTDLWSEVYNSLKQTIEAI